MNCPKCNYKAKPTLHAGSDLDKGIIICGYTLNYTKLYCKECGYKWDVKDEKVI